MTDIVQWLRGLSETRRKAFGEPGLAGARFEEAAAEIERLRAVVLDACNVFDHYDLPEHAFHYRRDLLGLEEAKQIARNRLNEQTTREKD